MNQKGKYPVYCSQGPITLRFLLVLGVLFCIGLSLYTGFLFLYGAALVVFAIATYAIIRLHAYVTFCDDGIHLHSGLRRHYTMRWENILCCGTFSLIIMGTTQSEAYIYFSAKPIDIARIEQGTVLPELSEDLFFLTYQDCVANAVGQYWKSKQAERLLLPQKEKTSSQQASSRTVILQRMLWVLCFFCIAAAFASGDWRWLIVAVLSGVSVFACFNHKNNCKSNP